MSNDERNIDILEHIIKYCKEITETHMHFGKSHEAFKANSIYKNAIAMCILQIGELTNHLSDDFKEMYTGVPWQNIKGMRNFVAHRYGQIDIDILWTTSNERITELYDYCNSIVEQHRVLEQPAVEIEDEEEYEI